MCAPNCAKTLPVGQSTSGRVRTALRRMRKHCRTTRQTKPGMYAVVIAYEKTAVKDRMEAVLDIFGAESESDAKKVGTAVSIQVESEGNRR